MNKCFWCLVGILIFSCSSTAAMARDLPNILLAISDDQSFPHASVYQATELSTPGFDQVARQGVLFQNGFAASPGCSPSRAALLTGRHTWQIREAGTHASSFPADLQVFPDLLEQAGYFIGYTGKAWGPGNWKISGRTRNPAGVPYSKIRTKERPQGIAATDYAANFADFMTNKRTDQPFFFWFGCQEPHRSYQLGLGQEMGKNPENVEVPDFLPDHPEIRSDILDYYAEIEWFDQHLVKMLKLLEQQGELDNTLVIVTSDNGMPFPRAKANCYEYGVHVPLAMSWPALAPGNRICEDPVGFVDITATILEAAGIDHSAVKTQLSGKSLVSLMRSEKSGRIEPERKAVFFARERHSSSRYNNWTYPQRGMRTDEFLLIRNFRPERWPAGDPQKYGKDNQLGPMHGGYHDIDACPSLTFLIEHREHPQFSKFFHLSVDHRPAWELFQIQNDPGCLNNLADKPKYAQQFAELKADLERKLKMTADPRQIDGGEIFESYPRYSPIRKFPAPE